jgi:hypothetical protein
MVRKESEERDEKELLLYYLETDFPLFFEQALKGCPLSLKFEMGRMQYHPPVGISLVVESDNEDYIACITTGQSFKTMNQD